MGNDDQRERDREMAEENRAPGEDPEDPEDSEDAAADEQNQDDHRDDRPFRS
jgi:hypothetical protein